MQSDPAQALREARDDLLETLADQICKLIPSDDEELLKVDRVLGRFLKARFVMHDHERAIAASEKKENGDV